jgi:hypothetical protein
MRPPGRRVAKPGEHRAVALLQGLVEQSQSEIKPHALANDAVDLGATAIGARSCGGHADSETAGC